MLIKHKLSFIIKCSIPEEVAIPALGRVPRAVLIFIGSLLDEGRAGAGEAVAHADVARDVGAGVRRPVRVAGGDHGR